MCRIEQNTSEVKAHNGKLRVTLVWFENHLVPEDKPTVLVGAVTIPLASLHDEGLHSRWYVLDEIPSGSVNSHAQLHLQLQYTFSKNTNLGAELLLNDAKELLQLVVDPSAEFAMALCSSVDISESQKVAAALVNIFVYYDRIQFLLKTAITSEVAATSDPHSHALH